LAEVPVSVGIMDAWAAMYGVGLKGEGDAVYLSGTSEVLGIVSGRAQPEPGVLVFPRNGGVTLHAGPTQSGGASVAWFCKAFGVTPEQMEQEAAGAGATPLFLPHLSGERAPLWDAAARGAFLGLGAGMGRGEMARAVYEGVAYSARLLLASLEASAMRRAEVILCGGGGFRSDLWNQIRADVLGRPLQRLAVPDAGLVGAAAIASVAAGLHGDLGAALAGLVRHDRTYHPDPVRSAAHDDRFALYRPAYEALVAVITPYLAQPGTQFYVEAFRPAAELGWRST
jgi:xylulokinase